MQTTIWATRPAPLIRCLGCPDPQNCLNDIGKDIHYARAMIAVLFGFDRKDCVKPVIFVKITLLRQISLGETNGLE